MRCFLSRFIAQILCFSAFCPAAQINNSALIPAIVPHEGVRMEGLSPDWVKSLIIAELRIETATEKGTFDAAIPLLDHYAEMGVNTLWIGPIYDRKTTDGYNNGYKNFGPHTVWPQLTGATCVEESYKVIRRFVDAAHERNIRIILDIISWGVALDAPLIKEKPDFWIRLKDGQYRVAYDGHLFDWTKQEVREWFKTQAVRLIEETNADGYRVDLAPDTSGYHFKETRDALYERGRKVLVFSEMPSEPKGTFDFAQLGVNGWTELPAYGKPDVLKAQKEKFGGLHDSSFMFRSNLVDAIKTGMGIGRPPLQQKGDGGRFRFYAASPAFHDSKAFVRGNIVRFGYLALSPFIPIWYIGEEWNNPIHMPRGGDILYWNRIDWAAKSARENAAFFEEVKRVLRVRRQFPEIFEYFSESLRDANIEKVEVLRDGKPNLLQAYMRYAKDNAVLVVPNYEADQAVSEFKIEIPWKAWGVERSGTFQVTDLMTNRVLLREAAADLGSFDAVLPAGQLGVYLIERDEGT
jgi:hypothetical protein